MKRFIWLILFFPVTVFASCTTPEEPTAIIPVNICNNGVCITKNSYHNSVCENTTDLSLVKYYFNTGNGSQDPIYQQQIISLCQQQISTYQAAVTAYQACFEQSVKQPYTPLPPPAPSPAPALINSNGPTIPDHWTPPVTNIPLSTPTPAVIPTPESVSDPIIAPSPAPVFKAPIKKSAPKPVSVTVPISTDTQVTELTTKSYVPPVIAPAHNNIFSRFWSFIKSLF